MVMTAPTSSHTGGNLLAPPTAKLSLIVKKLVMYEVKYERKFVMDH